MKLTDMNPKLGILATIVTGSILIATFHSIAMATPAEHYDPKQMHQEKMQERMKVRLDRLAARLEIKSSQQTVWEEFARSVETLADRTGKKPGDDADAAAISRYRADRATEFAKKLTKIADATARLQAALTEDQRKILDQTAHHFFRREHGAGSAHHGMDRGQKDHGWNQHEHGAS